MSDDGSANLLDGTSAASSAEETKKYRALLQQERHRVEHLSLVNAVQRCILSTSELEAFLPQVAKTLAQHFTQCEITIYLHGPATDHDHEDDTAQRPLRVMARAGLALAATDPLALSQSLPMQCVRQKQTLCRNFTERLSADCEDIDSSPLSFFEIPLAQDERFFGVLELISESRSALNASDAVILQMIGALLAGRIEACQVHDEMRQLNAFQQSLFSTMMQSLLVIDGEGKVRFANQHMYQMLGARPGELAQSSLSDVFEPEDLRASGLMEAVQDAIQNGVPHELESVRLTPLGHHEPNASSLFDVRIFRVFYRSKPQAAMLLIDLTARWRNYHQLQLMSEIGQFFSASLNINTVLRTVLTCVTAGNALGFNRAFLLLADDAGVQLKGTMALGPASAAEAYQIWRELSTRDWDLQQILEAAENVSKTQQSSPLQEKIRTVAIDLENPLFPALQTSLAEKRALCTPRDELVATEMPRDLPDEFHQQWETVRALFTASEMVVAPLHAKGKLVGVVLADNAFSGKPIEESDVQLLNSLAGQAGLTIDNARTYQALEKAQKEVVNAERLAVVGDMTARLSHEIRNPLSTIGGFARRLYKNPQDENAIKRYASVIVEETDRLEELLEDLLHMANSHKLDLKLQPLHEIIDKALLLADADIKSQHVRVETDYDSKVPRILIDRSRILQALLNIMRNGAQAMDHGGLLLVRTRLDTTGKNPKVIITVTDQGKGMSPNAIKRVYDPFFSTKIKGSGLGLAITWRIIRDHEGDIAIQSEEDKGTTFIITLPVRNE